MTLLEKRVVLAGLRCHPYAWHLQHTPATPPSPGLEWLFYAGNETGARAREVFGPGCLLPRTPLDRAIEATADAVRRGTERVLFEASFAWGSVVARADVLRRSGSAWAVLEVKAGKSPDDGEVDEEDLDDLAYTTCVAARAGLPIDRVALVLLNRDYRLGGNAPLLAEIDVTEAAMKRANEIAAEAQAIAAAALSDVPPARRLEFRCGKCEIFDTDCLGVDVPDALFTLPRLSKKRFEEIRGYERVSRIPAGASLTEPQARVAEVIRSGRPFVGPGMRLLDDVVWPARYLDVETVSPFVPWFDARPPFDSVPFQYSVHLLRSPADDPEHREYLAPTIGDWRRDLTERLLGDLGTVGSIVCYSSYERTSLNGLARLFPDLQPQLEAVCGRLFDLEKVIREGYCHPGFAGRTSIKKVLPVLVPELGYDGLAVGNGTDASGVFALMRVGQYPAADHDRWRKRLLEYCGLDTMAMVRVHQALLRIRAES